MNSFYVEAQQRDECDDSSLKTTVFAVLLSAGLHSVVMAVFLNGEIATVAEKQPASIAISLLSSNPLKSTLEVLIQAADEQSVAEVEALDVSSEDTHSLNVTESDIVEELAIENIDSESREDNITQGIVEVESLREPVTVDLPTSASVAESLSIMRSQGRSRFYRLKCNPLDDESHLRDCEPASSRDYSDLEVNTVYRALNPVREYSRSQQSLGVVSSQSRELATRLNSSAIPQGLSAYVLEELEAGISHHVNEGNRAVNHLLDMTDKSSAAAQAKQILEDGFVIKRSAELEKRKVTTP